MNFAICRVVLVTGKKVPKNICGRMNTNEMPVAASGVLDTVAVISPKPTELSEKIAVTGNAKNTP